MLGQNLDLVGANFLGFFDNVAVSNTVIFNNHLVADLGFGQGIKNGQGIAGAIQLRQRGMTKDNGVAVTAG